MDTTTVIRIIAGLLFLCLIPVAILYVITLSNALKKCAPQARTMESGMVWLLFIPLFNLIWHFFVVIALARSLGNEFRLRNVQNVPPEPAKGIGIAMGVCGACAIIPVVGLLPGLAQLILWILYWSKIAEYSRMLDQTQPVYGSQAGMIG